MKKTKVPFRYTHGLFSSEEAEEDEEELEFMLCVVLVNKVLFWDLGNWDLGNWDLGNWTWEIGTWEIGTWEIGTWEIGSN